MALLHFQPGTDGGKHFKAHPFRIVDRIDALVVGCPFWSGICQILIICCHNPIIDIYQSLPIFVGRRK